MRPVLLLVIPLLCHLANYGQDLTVYALQLKDTSLRIQMLPVAAGTFRMGSPEKEAGRKNDEGPVHQVTVGAFWMSATEITWDVYEKFVYGDTIIMGIDAVTRPTKPYIDITFGMGKKGFPAVGMTQYNAIQFCRWLYAQTGVFYRLPTEAEWEYACRAGKETNKNFDGWTAANSNGKTMPVGQKKPNAWGFYDMHGNVAEWTNDQYLPGFYTRSGSIDPVSEVNKLYPVTLRGGSFKDDVEQCRCASRKASEPSWKRLDPQIPKSNWWFPEAPFVGVRIVRPAKNPSADEINAYYNRKPIPDY